MPNKNLKLYIPRMSYCGARVSAAAFKSIGIDAEPSPESDARTLELSAKYLSGDECLPEKITLGNFLKIIEDEYFDPEYTAFLMPTAGGPCRFGQYKPLFKKILKDKGYKNAKIFSPTSTDGYEGFGEHSTHFFRLFWNAIVAGDILRKLHLRTRPYELHKGSTNEQFHLCLDEICDAISEPGIEMKQRLNNIKQALINTRDRYRQIPLNLVRGKPLIGIVGEIYCRLNEFSNAYLVDKVEEHGGETWMADVMEWGLYTNDEQHWRLTNAGRIFSLDMLKLKIKQYVMHHDEKNLMTPFRDDFIGYEEPDNVRDILNYSHPYLPREGALGEMVLNVGKAIYLYNKGADGIIDISPFSCMNGIVCEAIYPQVSKDFDNFPMRIFYFDGNQNNLDRDVGIFMELVRNYQKTKKTLRKYPAMFK